MTGSPPITAHHHEHEPVQLADDAVPAALQAVPHVHHLAQRHLEGHQDALHEVRHRIVSLTEFKLNKNNIFIWSYESIDNLEANEFNWQFYTYKTFLVVVRVTAHISHEAEEYDEECLGESHDEDEEDGAESCEVLHHHAVDHGDHGADQLDAAAEEEEVEAVAEHADDGEDVLHVGEAEHPRRHHQQHRDAPQQEDHPGNDGSIDNVDISVSLLCCR